jgi:translation initiation factor 1
VRRERAGRKGKTVTVAAPLALDRDAARALVRELKRELGSGGSVGATDQPGLLSIEIQGDHVRRLAEALRRRGLDAREGGAGR